MSSFNNRRRPETTDEKRRRWAREEADYQRREAQRESDRQTEQDRLAAALAPEAEDDPEPVVDHRPWYDRESGHEQYLRRLKEKAADDKAREKAFVEGPQS
jgi:hypothetical protein